MTSKTIILSGLLGLFSFSFSHAQNALNFDGSNDGMNCGTDSAFDIGGNALSLEAWIYAESWKNNIYDGSIIIKEDNTNNSGYMLRAGNGGRGGFAIGDGSKNWREINTSSPVLSLNTWHHMAATYDGSKMKLYVDGTLVDSLSVSTSIGINTSTPLSIGYHPSTGRYWDGNIDEVRVWKKTLTAAEINAHMNQEFCTRQNYQLRAYYKFSQGTANSNNSTQTSILDYSIFQNPGSLSGFTLNGTQSNLVAGASLATDTSYAFDSISHCGPFYDAPTKTYYQQTGTYSIPFKSHMGCDSILLREATINSNTTFLIKAAVCDSFISPLGNVYRKSGTFYNVLTNHVNCDSIITIQLKVGSDSAFIDTTVCESYTSPAGNTHTSSAVFTDHISSYIACDSTVTVDLTVNYHTSFTTTEYICDSVLAPSGTKWYYIPGVYTETLVNNSGCDSVVNLTLQSAKTEHSIQPNVCDVYQSPKGNNYSNSGNYYEHFINHLGCDSLLTIELTVKESSSSMLNVNGCDSARSVSNRFLYTQSGTYFDTIVNAAGCDSFVQMQVAITKINTTVNVEDYTLTALHTTGSYQWLDCENNKAEISGKNSISISNQHRGEFAVEITENGCVDTSNCYALAGLSVDDLENPTRLKLYPNPTTSNITIQSEFILNDVGITIRNIYGQAVFNANYPSLINEEIDLALPAGNYLVEIQSDKGNKLIKLLVL